MKVLLAALLVASGAVALAPRPAAAESSYWEERSREPARLGYGEDGSRARDHVDVRIRKRAPRARAERSYNGPVYQTQEQVQQSVYDFATGGPGNVKDYW